MPSEEELGDRGERPAVLHAAEAVAFVGIPDVRHRDRALPHRFDDLIGFRRLHPDVVGALRDEERPDDPIDVVQRRALLEEALTGLGRVVTHSGFPDGLHRLPVRRHRRHHRREVRDPEDVDGARELLRGQRHARERGVPAVARAVDGDTLGIRDLLRDRPVDCIDEVDWAIAQKIADPQRVAIYGASYGGYAALAGVTLTPEKFACAVDIFGISNLSTMMATVPPYWKPMQTIWKARMGDYTTEAGQ